MYIYIYISQWMRLFGKKPSVYSINLDYIDYMLFQRVHESPMKSFHKYICLWIIRCFSVVFDFVFFEINFELTWKKL